MVTVDEISVSTGQLVRIRAIIDDPHGAVIEYENGLTGKISTKEPLPYKSGSILLVSGNQASLVPESAWSESTSIAVVRRILDDDRVLIDASGNLKVVATRVSVTPGNTVEFAPFSGITKVLSEDPIRTQDTLFGDDAGSKYRLPTGDSSLSFAKFGGYKHVVERAKLLIETQLNDKERLESIGARPIKGVLLTGPPGTGKTYLARIIAKESDAAFYLISGPAVLSKYVGDSEDTLRSIFEDASRQEKAIIFFDEIDSLASRRSSSSHEHSKQLVAQLLTLLDGFDKSGGNIVVIATTNRVDDIDEALQRPGRFDWEIEFGLPTLEDRREILRVGAEDLRTADNLPLEEVALLTEGWSAARLSSLWSESALLSAADMRSRITSEDFVIGYDRVASRPVRTAKERGDGKDA
ncbi:ATP-binding protein [Paenarthrobacter sp. NPDC058040]|uniref:ATP-binding protein n=1 Tax=unclassified Paenarthrobacter TaxID=2634190 RepID=UPI0036D88B0C